MEKRCCRCRKPRPIERFGLDRSRPDGRQKVCKDCQAQYRVRNRKQIQQRQRDAYQIKARAQGRKQWHRLSKTVEHHIWRHILWRCYNTRCSQYKNYGGRGIIVCERWKTSFLNFWKDMGPRPGDGWTIERNNTAGNYEPGNCRWATQQEQQNNRTNNRRLKFRGQVKTLAEWSRATGIASGTILRRIDKYGWTISRALQEPVRGSTRGRNALVAG